jgi:serine/threonine protein kinase/uncharacterized protein YjdB
MRHDHRHIMTPGTTVLCTNCRAPVKGGEKWCSNCGAPVTGSSPAVSTGTPVSFPETGSSFSWDAVSQRLRELTLGQYEILAELGRGGMAAVYLAHEYSLNRKVALKVMSPAIMMTEGMVERFHAEAVTQANLTHANIVGVHAVRREQDLHYFAMQFVPGRSLQQVIRAEHAHERLLSLAIIRSLIYQVGSALSYAHRRGVIHRDVKPANVMLNADGDAVVTDFGIAKVAATPSQTLTGTVVGTAPYMSPEQCYASVLTPASDQYSLGILAYELLVGAPPFNGTSFVVMQAHTLQAPPPIGPRRPDCPPEFEAAVMTMLGKRREDRFPDIDAALRALEARPAPSAVDDPVRRDLVRLADTAGVEARLADVLRVPLSPMPQTRSGSVPRYGPSPTPGPHGRLRDLSQPTAPTAALRLDQPPARVEMGERFRIAVTARDANGAVIDHVPLLWSSSDAKVVRVGADSGEIEAISPGTVDIVVVSGSAAATVRLVVQEPAVAKIVAEGLPSEVEIGDTVNLVAHPFDSRGTRLDRPVAWSARQTATVTVTPAGNLTAKATGAATLVAAAGDASAEFQVRVIAQRAARIEARDAPEVIGVGESLSMGATVRDKHGNELAARPVHWTSDNSAIVAVTPSGVVTGVAPGRATLQAHCDEQVARVTISVDRVPLSKLEVEGIPARARMKTTKRLQVAATDLAGRARALPVQWHSTDPNVATIDENATLTARAPGRVELRAQCGTVERTFPLEVYEVVPLTQRLRGVGLMVAAVVVGVAAVGIVATILMPGWWQRSASGDSAVVGGVAGNTEPPPPTPRDTIVTLHMAEIPMLMNVGDRVDGRLSATVADTNVAVPRSAWWRSSDPAVLQVDSATGRVVARREGTASVMVMAGSTPGTSLTVTVQRPLLAVDSGRRQGGRQQQAGSDRRQTGATSTTGGESGRGAAQPQPPLQPQPQPQPQPPAGDAGRGKVEPDPPPTPPRPMTFLEAVNSALRNVEGLLRARDRNAMRLMLGADETDRLWRTFEGRPQIIPTVKLVGAFVADSSADIALTIEDGSNRVVLFSSPYTAKFVQVAGALKVWYIRRN